MLKASTYTTGKNGVWIVKGAINNRLDIKKTLKIQGN